MPADIDHPPLSLTDKLVAVVEGGLSSEYPQDMLSLGAFAYIGLRNSDGSPKPALEVWDEMHNR